MRKIIVCYMIIKSGRKALGFDSLEGGGGGVVTNLSPFILIVHVVAYVIHGMNDAMPCITQVEYHINVVYVTNAYALQFYRHILMKSNWYGELLACVCYSCIWCCAVWCVVVQ